MMLGGIFSIVPLYNNLKLCTSSVQELNLAIISVTYWEGGNVDDYSTHRTSFFQLEFSSRSGCENLRGGHKMNGSMR